MKKIFTLAAVAAFALSVSAENTSNWKATWNTLTNDANATINATVEGSNTVTAQPINSKCFTTELQKTYKDLSGASQQFGDGTTGYIKYTPSITDKEYTIPSDGTDNSYCLEFVAEETDEMLSFDNLSVDFDATRLGTDAMRLGVGIEVEDVEYSTDRFTLSYDNYAQCVDGESWAMQKDDAGAVVGPYTVGWTPIREDLSKATNASKKTTPWSHFSLNKTLATPGYKVTVKIYVTGVKNNKGFLVENLTISTGDKASGINGVKDSAEAAASQTKTIKYVKDGQIIIGNHNIAGQRVK